MSRPRCGNDPRAQLTDGDRQVVESFKAYLADRAALRDRIAEAALSAVEAALGDTLLPAAREEALTGIAAVLPPPVSRADVYRELADQQEQIAATDVIRRRRSIATARRLFAVELRRMADEAQPGTEGPHEHVWVTALDGDDQPAKDETGRTWTHCGVCGTRRNEAQP